MRLTVHSPDVAIALHSLNAAAAGDSDGCSGCAAFPPAESTDALGSLFDNAPDGRDPDDVWR